MKKSKIRLRGWIAIGTAAFIVVSAALVISLNVITKNIINLSPAEPVSVGQHEMAAVALPLGDSECTAVITDKGAALIDTGDEDDSKRILSFLSVNGINSLEYLVITNFDDEHIGGAADIINSLDIKRVLVPEALSDDINGDEYMSFITALNNKNITPYTVIKNLGFSLSDASFTVYSGTGGKYSSDKSDNMSLVISAVHGANTFLFASDIKSERMAEIISEEKSFQHTYLKTPSHGEFGKNTNEFYSFVNPKYAVITNENGHDIKKAVSALESLGTQVFTDDKKGVYAVSDMNEINIYLK